MQENTGLRRVRKIIISVYLSVTRCLSENIMSNKERVQKEHLKIFSSIGNSLCLFIFCQNDTCANKAALIELSHFVLKRRRTCTISFSKFETIVSIEMCPPFRENLYLCLRTYPRDKSYRLDINKTDKTTYTPMAT